MCDNVAHFYKTHLSIVANHDGDFILYQALPNVHYNHYLHNGYVAF